MIDLNHESQKELTKNRQFANIKGEQFEMNGLYELAFADILNSRNIYWIKNAEKFTISNGTSDDGMQYVPDFFIPDCNLWIEIKGSRRGRHVTISKLKIKAFKNILNVKLFYFRNNLGNIKSQEQCEEWLDNNLTIE